MHRTGLCETLGQPFWRQHTRHTVLHAFLPTDVRSLPKVPDTSILFKGFKQAFSQDEMAPPGVSWENLRFPAPLGPGTKREELHLLPSPPTLGRTNCAVTRQLLEQKGSNILWESPTPIPFPLTFPKFIWLCLRLHKLGKLASKGA